ncbi:efflux RND transporter periplasmic adaptor subunit [Ottowia thiooxydans]|uniref:efflux RND transporter periplasmic adaptor subunit n=1 Tax=Ottowia thiooxydans TaxID=219182 RepID=UPI00040B07F5|nr:efflux RND transporter periplasmic adaptor subunit [Ottowia thiooxydans]
MKTSNTLEISAAAILVVTAAITFVLAWDVPVTHAQEATVPSAKQSSMTVVVATPQSAALPVRISANGNILAWQEASIGSEANGLRLIEVKVNVGDSVRRGQALAIFASDTVEAELAQSRAAVAEAEVALAEAAANAERARLLTESGALSAQLILQYLSAERTARARLDAAKAVEKMQQIRLTHTRVTAPDDGIISARTATVGAVLPSGQELFRLIRGSRLEWRAEVAATDLAKLKAGQKVSITPVGGDVIEGRVRMLAPAIDIQTRNGLAYVDLPRSETARAGMFARGEFEIHSADVMTLPQSAVQLREGFSYVIQVGPDLKTIQTKIKTGRRSNDRVEILEGLDKNARVIVSGAAFLSDGDLVHIATKSGAAIPATPSSTSLRFMPANRGGTP